MSFSNNKNLQITESEFNQILCPNLRIGINEGHLQPDIEGWILEDDLRSYLSFVGVKKRSLIISRLISIGKRVVRQKRDNQINIIRFKNTLLDHGSSSGIINNEQGFDQTRLELLLSYLDEDGRLYINNTLPALNHFHQCPFHKKTTLGTNLATFEFASILQIYGQKDYKGRKFFTKEDIEDIWKHHRFPKSWTAPKRPFYSTRLAIFNYTKALASRKRLGTSILKINK